MSFYKNISNIQDFVLDEYLKVGERRILRMKDIINKKGFNIDCPAELDNILIEVSPISDNPFSDYSTCTDCVFRCHKEKQEYCFLSSFATTCCFGRKRVFLDKDADSIIYKKVEL